MIDINQIRNDFPILARQVNGHRLVYLDNAATSQKPLPVIDALVDYYHNYNANVHRGIHTLADESTKIYNSARQAVADFIGAGDRREIVFVRNTTEAINLIAYSWGRANIQAGDEILLTQMEHHSNIVPWQMLADEKKAVVKYASVTPAGKLDLDDLKNKLSSRTKLVSVVHVSNFLGTINPIREIAEIIKEQRTKNKEQSLFLVDGAQAVPHLPVNVSELGGDFYAFSGHKMYGPMGIGCLWGRREILESMPPFLTGGGMIRAVDIASGTTFTDLPDKFEAGTPNVAGAVGLAAAVKYLQEIGMGNVRRYEMELTKYAFDKLGKGSTFAGQRLNLKILGPLNADQRGGLLAFTLTVNGKEIHGHDVAQILDGEGIALRSGHHCTMPMHTNLGLAATTRVSFGIYNTKEDVDRFVSALKRVPETFS